MGTETLGTHGAVDVEVAADKGYETVFRPLFAEQEVTDMSANGVVALHVRLDIYIGCGGDDIVLGSHTQAFQVEMGDTPFHMKVGKTVGEGAVDSKVASHDSVPAVHLGVEGTAVQAQLTAKAGKVVVAVAEVADVDGHLGSCRGTEEVGATPLGDDVAAERTKPLTGNEVLQVQVGGTGVDVILLGTGIEEAFGTQAAATFGRHEVGGVALGVDLHVAVDAYATGDAYLLLRLWRQHGGDEVEVFSPALHAHVGTQTVCVGGVGYPSGGGQVEGRGQLGMEVLEGEVFQVAFGMPLQRQRLTGPLRHHLLGQRGNEYLYVVLAHIAVGIDEELAGILVGKGVQVHLITG